MEKRLLAFLWVSVCVVVAFTMLQRLTVGPPPPPPAAAVDDDIVAADERQAGPAEVPETDAPPTESNAADDPSRQPTVAAERAPPPRHHPPQRISLGSLDPNSGYNLLVTFNNAGGTVERIELNSPHYRELDDRSGYLGHLAISDDPESGVRVEVVGDGTPAAQATSADYPQPGLRGPRYERNADSVTLQTPGDRIVALDDQPINDVGAFASFMQDTRPGQTLRMTVIRSGTNGETRSTEFRTQLVSVPLSLVRPEVDSPIGSFPLAVYQLDDQKAALDQSEISRLPSVRTANWSVHTLPEKDQAWGPGVEFRYALSEDDLQRAQLSGSWQLVKRFRLAKRGAASEDTQRAQGYQLSLEIELRNTGTAAQRIAYQLDGASGLTDEGWWYSYKVHPRKFAAAGARDIVFRTREGRHELFLCPAITTHAEENPKSPNKPLIDSSQQVVHIDYAGTDAQYFSTVLMPDPGSDETDPYYAADGYAYSNAVAHVIGSPNPEIKKRTNVTCRLMSQQQEIAPQDALRHRYVIFTGPKSPEVLQNYGLDECIVYGWFGVVARPMVSLLHILYRISFSLSFGLAIILLTVLVRGAMFPFGRQMAMNAAKMQELAPEMKRIADKYADDLEKRGQAQRELFRKHKYNPFGGCIVSLLQLPVFVGLYRALSVDIALRQAPLIPGIAWCANLAGPDKLWHWESLLPSFLSDPYGWLGPYLNILPIFSILLMLVHQKLFTPPPQDDQQRSQQQVMKFMMLFFGVMFHKIASGLCIYFIASSLWGLAERKLLPKSKTGAVNPSTPANAKSDKGVGNHRPGDSRKKAKRRSKR